MQLGIPIGRRCIDLGLMVSLAWLGPGLHAEEPRQDWSRVQALPADQKIVVKPFKGMGLKVKGTYVSSDAGQIVVRRRNAQAVTIPKERIHLVARKHRIRHAAKIGAAAGFFLCAGWTMSEGDFIQPGSALFFGGIGAGIGALVGLAVRGGGIHSVVYQVDDQDIGPSNNP